MSVLGQAIELARMQHAGQKDKQDQPFIGHPLRVMALLAPDEVLMTIGVLHDILEDTSLTMEELVGYQGGIFGYDADIILGVDLMTRRPGMTYRRYIERIATYPRIVPVKIADIRDNSHPLRTTTKALQKMVPERYEPALYYLNFGIWNPARVVAK